MNLQQEYPQTMQASENTTQKEKGGARIGFTGRTYSDLRDDLTLPSFEYAVDGMFCLGEVSMIVAEAKMGKTWLGVQLAVCAARGLPFLDRKVRQMKVMYLDIEMGSVDERARSMAVAQELGVIDKELDIAFIAGDEQDTVPTLDNLEEGLDGFMEEKGWDFKDLLIVLDTYGEMAGDLNESSATATKQVLAKVRRLARRRNCAVLILHHTTKDGEQYRGSSAIRATVDNLMYLRWAKREEQQRARVGRGKPFVVLVDDARRRRAPFEPMHLTRVPIHGKPDPASSGLDGDATVGNTLGFIWKSLGPVGEEDAGLLPAEQMPWEEDGKLPEEEVGGGTVSRTGKEERAAAVVSLFRREEERVPRSELEKRYAGKQHLGLESGKKAVKDAIDLGWIAKGIAFRDPYWLTGVGKQEWNRMRPAETSASSILDLSDLMGDGLSLADLMTGNDGTLSAGGGFA